MMNKVKTFSILSLIVLLIAVAGQGVVCCFAPSASAAALLPVPLFFWSLYSVALLSQKSPCSSDSLAKFILGFKAAKIFLALVAVAVMAFLMRGEALVIVLYFFGFQTVMLVVESLFLLNIKKKTR